MKCFMEKKKKKREKKRSKGGELLRGSGRAGACLHGDSLAKLEFVAPNLAVGSSFECKLFPFFPSLRPFP